VRRFFFRSFSCYDEFVISKDDINLEIRTLLQLADEAVLTRTIWALSPEQKHSRIFKEIGQQRYLSALRAGAIDNAEMTKSAFKFDLLFLHSKIVAEAAQHGLALKIADGQIDIAEKIKTLMGLTDLSTTDEVPVVDNPTESV
jgi:hypothetical protein